MSAVSKIARRWKPFAVGTVFAAAEAFFINKVSGDDPAWWWWMMLLLALVGVIGCGVWAWLTPSEVEEAQGNNFVRGDVKDGGAATQQSAGAHGQNINLRADNSSVAVNEIGIIGTLNVGQPPTEPSGS